MKIPAFANNLFNMISFSNEVTSQSLSFESDEIDKHTNDTVAERTAATTNSHYDENKLYVDCDRDNKSSMTTSTDYYYCPTSTSASPSSLSSSSSSTSSLSLILSTPSSLSLTFSETFEIEIDEKMRGINKSKTNRIGWEEMVSSYGKVARRV
mmetsp:Transcript_760/g.1198  ORF Transcript_760/g.1198 Transcript_760/m.1198 type:complete len:153 (+) Transcript_760:360-818(+)|eukprot:CAMPEP_0203677828 /NCGR_PEP_ID=MMETSP0090-20130426/29730_1 /ASSEMBLY_ACC=CAM_ASM_001088 /TAXON_ID=426623 /ORGANISM="Chaetoceros affinis, Strain CCMP159" /LENGTH=152 /DNA_ID=CAMNT_0050544843 /DNA_START=312 /DNA_END=770 /DNA_ORIENTATION=+